MKDKFCGPLGRRSFLIQSNTLLAALLLGGCGSDGSAFTFTDSSPGGGASGNPLPPGTGVLGTINRAHFGGSGLEVRAAGSLHGVVTGNEFNTVVSSVAAQALVLTDDSGKIRGFTIALPGVPPIFDADSTAAALVFLTLGILTVDPTEAATRLKAIRALPTFAALSSFLAANLPTKDLNGLLSDPAFPRLREAVRDEFLALPALKATLDSGLVNANLEKTGSTANIGFENFGARFVAVVRQELDKPPHETGHFVPEMKSANNPVPGLANNLISGLNLLSWGTLLTKQVNSPGTASDSIDLSTRPAVRQFSYYVRGLGRNGNGVALPDTIPGQLFNEDVARMATFLFYFMGPFLDVFGAAGEVLSSLPKMVKAGASLVGAGVNGTALEAAFNTGNADNIKQAAADLFVAVLGISAASLAVLLPAVAAPFVLFGALLLAGGSGVFAFFDVQAFALEFLFLPSLARVDLPLGVPKYLATRLPNPKPVSLGHSGDGGALGVNAAGKVLLLVNDSTGSTTLYLHDSKSTQADEVLFQSFASPTDLVATGPFFNSINRALNSGGDAIYSVITQVSAPGGGLVSQEVKGFVRYADGLVSKLGSFLDSTYLFPTAINDTQQLVGLWREGSFFDNLHYKGFRWSNGILFSLDIAFDLGEPDFSVSFISINQRGDIAGSGSGGGKNWVFFLPFGTQARKIAQGDFLGLSDAAEVLFRKSSFTEEAWQVWKADVFQADTFTDVVLPGAGVRLKTMNSAGFIIGGDSVVNYLWLTPDSPQLIPADTAAKGFVPTWVSEGLHLVGNAAAEELPRPDGLGVFITLPVYLFSPTS